MVEQEHSALRERLAVLRAAEQAAAPGPWHTEDRGTARALVVSENTDLVLDVFPRADAELIVLARNLMPGLLDYADAMLAEYDDSEYWFHRSDVRSGLGVAIAALGKALGVEA